MKYIMTADYHTHTVYSHGKGTIRENVLEARKHGLKEIAITDHGPGHLEHGLKMENISEMREIVDGLNSEFDDIKVHLGIEANILNRNNNLDVPPEDFSHFDFVIAGYHYGMPNAYCAENFIDYSKGYRRRELMMKNTQMVLTAIYENNLKILTHPGNKANFDMLELARACADTGTLMEISTQHEHLSLSNIRLCAKTDVSFVISSDAHKPEDVGDFRLGLKRALEAGLDPERIINITQISE